MLGEADEKCLDTWAARDKGEEKEEEEEERGAVKVGGASVADVRQTEREAVEVALPSRAKGGRVIGCVGNGFNVFCFFVLLSTSDTKLEIVPFNHTGISSNVVMRGGVTPLTVSEVCILKKRKYQKKNMAVPKVGMFMINPN